MKKLKLNKKTISALDKSEMQGIEGGFCIVSCKKSRNNKDCCGSGRIDVIIFSITVGDTTCS
jgi:natural product precursor